MCHRVSSWSSSLISWSKLKALRCLPRSAAVVPLVCQLRCQKSRALILISVFYIFYRHQLGGRLVRQPQIHSIALCTVFLARTCPIFGLVAKSLFFWQNGFDKKRKITRVKTKFKLILLLLPSTAGDKTKCGQPFNIWTTTRSFLWVFKMWQKLWHSVWKGSFVFSEILIIYENIHAYV